MVRKKQGRRSARAGSADAVQGKMLNALHQVWLAGLGAAVRAQRGAPKLLDELIAEGASFQQGKQELAEETFRRIAGDARARLQQSLGEVRGQASEALENLEKIFQSRVQRALAQLGVPSAGELTALSRRVDALNDHIEKLARRRTAAPKARGNARAHSKLSAHAVP